MVSHGEGAAFVAAVFLECAVERLQECFLLVSIVFCGLGFGQVGDFGVGHGRRSNRVRLNEIAATDRGAKHRLIAALQCSALTAMTSTATTKNRSTCHGNASREPAVALAQRERRPMSAAR